MKIKLPVMLYWHKWSWEEKLSYEVFSVRLADEPDRGFIAQQEMEFEVPDDYDPTPQIIAGLKTEKQRILAEAHVKAGNIDEQIQRLLCIEHKP